MPRKVSARKAAKESITHLGVVAPPPIHVESPHFSGSLAMLFNVVWERKIDLLDVALQPVCQAYFEYLVASSLDNLDEAAAALAALAYILERKAWALLPVAEPEPQMELPMELPEPSTAQYGTAIEALRLWQEERERFFFRSSEPDPSSYQLPMDLGEVSPSDLARAFERVLQKAKPEGSVSVPKARRPISDQMKIVLKVLDTGWKTLEELMTEPFSRTEAVYWFLAVLELIRLGQATVKLEKDNVLFARGQKA